MGARVFLSYARQDADQVQEIYQRLRNAGHTPWKDTEDIIAGEDWRRSISDAMRKADFFLACLSRNSVFKRGFVQREFKQALDLLQEQLGSDIYLIPVRLDACEMPEDLAHLQAVDWFVPSGSERLLRAIQVGLERRNPARVPPSTVIALPTPNGGTAAQFLNELLQTCHIYLRQLQVRAALQGITPGVWGEIEQMRATIQNLEPIRGTQPTGTVSVVNTETWRTERKRIEVVMQNLPEIKAAFENRNFELGLVLSPTSKPFVILSAPAGYGKTHLLDEAKRRLETNEPGQWLIVRHVCNSADTEIAVWVSLAQAMECSPSSPIRDVNDFCRHADHSLGVKMAQGLVIQFDVVEQWRHDGQWSDLAVFMQRRFALAFEQAMRLSNRKFKVIFAGRYISDFSNAFSRPYQELSLSPFDLTAIRDYVSETLRRFEQLQSRQLGYTLEDIEFLAEDLLEITGGHPRAVARVMQDIGNHGFAISLEEYFNAVAKRHLFDDFVADEITELFRGIARPMQDLFRILAVFRLFNGDTLQVLLDKHYVTGAGDGWELHRQVLRTHLAKESGFMSHDRILQRVLDTQMRFVEPTQYRELHGFAEWLYDCWLAGNNHKNGKLADGAPTGTDQVALMVESLYHTCRRLALNEIPFQVLQAKVESFLAYLRFFGGSTQGRRLLRAQIEDDPQLPILLKRILGEHSYAALLDLIVVLEHAPEEMQ